MRDESKWPQAADILARRPAIRLLSARDALRQAQGERTSGRKVERDE